METDEIVDASASFILDETKSFVRALFVGKKFNGVSEDIISEIEKRYWGSSQRALIVAIKTPLNIMLAIKRNTTVIFYKGHLMECILHSKLDR